MRLSLTKYGQFELVIITLFCLVAGVLLWLLNPILVLIPLLLFLGVIYFFRDPNRHIPVGDSLILAPADGKVIEINEQTEQSYFQEPTVKIAIFLSLLDVHINRAPCSGRITNMEYKKGKFLVASSPGASTLNESNTLTIDCEKPSGLRIILRQVAGIVARRIVCECRVSDFITRGVKFGMIKFGSRTEIFLPKVYVTGLEIKRGDKVKAGETILCRVKN